MAMPASPADGARNRYAQSFTSQIFEPANAREAPAFIPAGKRRDQTTSEMFGNYNDKELRAMPKTFVPKDNGTSARQKKYSFLSSDVLPHTVYAGYPHQSLSAVSPRARLEDPEAEEAEAINPHVRRQLELSSELFGRETPQQTAEEVVDPKKKLTPSDFKWFSIPENVHSTESKDVSHHDRSYHEKCSNLFSHKSPNVYQTTQLEQEEQEEESMGELKRRANVYYSDLFGRNTPMPDPEQGDRRRPKAQGPIEDQIVVHQDWTDSKTELVVGSRGQRPEKPAWRKSDEFNQSRVFGVKEYYTPADKMDAVSTDNSGKIRDSIGLPPQQIHQAHLRTSLTPNEFYEEAANTKHWEVIELHISGLRDDADEKTVRNLCVGFDLQIVKVNVEMDPVRNLCKGRAKIMVRYNPTRDCIAGLVQRLQETKLRVEM